MSPEHYKKDYWLLPSNKKGRAQELALTRKIGENFIILKRFTYYRYDIQSLDEAKKKAKEKADFLINRNSRIVEM